jgi:hypothetical protein
MKVLSLAFLERLREQFEGGQYGSIWPTLAQIPLAEGGSYTRVRFDAAQKVVERAMSDRDGFRHDPQ